jgi:hypothetical protein
MSCLPFFLIEIGEVKIRTTNPQFFANVRSLGLIAVAVPVLVMLLTV